MDAENRSVLDYYILPDTGMINAPLFERNGFDIDAFRSDSLEPLLGLVARFKISAGLELGQRCDLAMQANEYSPVTKRIGSRRSARGSSLERSPRRRAKKLFRMYRRERDRQRQTIGKGRRCRSRVEFVVGACRRLFADEHFATLLRAEGVNTLPSRLAALIGG
jgi:hypothetical protein